MIVRETDINQMNVKIKLQVPLGSLIMKVNPYHNGQCKMPPKCSVFIGPQQHF